MAKFIFELPDDMAALVEAFRIKRGYKATAVAVRELISTGLEVAGGLGLVQVGAPALREGPRKGGRNLEPSQIKVRPDAPKPVTPDVKSTVPLGRPPIKAGDLLKPAKGKK